MRKESWDKYSFSDSSGKRRFLEFLDDLYQQHGITLPDSIVKEVLDKGWNKTFHRVSRKGEILPGIMNFSRPQIHRLSGKPIDEIMPLPMDSVIRTVRSNGEADPKEASFCVCLEVYRNSPKNFSRNIKNLSPEKVERILRDKIQGIRIQNGIVESIVTNKNMNNSRLCVLNFRKVCKADIKNHQILMKAEVIRKLDSKIKSYGFKNISRWNPADVWLIRSTKHIEELLNIEEFSDLNETFNTKVQDWDIIPISLKTTDADLKGSSSLSLEYPVSKSGYSELLKTKDILNSISKIKKQRQIPVKFVLNAASKIKYSGPRKIKDFLESKEYLEQAKLSPNHCATYPAVLHWMAERFQQKNAKEALKSLAYSALSMTNESSPFYYASSQSASFIKPVVKDIEILNIVFELNSTAAKVNIKVQGKPLILNLRSRNGSSISAEIKDAVKGRSNIILLN